MTSLILNYPTRYQIQFIWMSLNNSQQKQYSLIRPTISLTLAVVLTISPRNMFSIPQLRCEGVQYLDHKSETGKLVDIYRYK